MTRNALGLSLALSLCVSAVALPTRSEAEDCTESLTIFQDVSGFGRKDRAASNMTKVHREKALDGWVFEDMDIYTENGDLEGFFITYSRAVDCARLRSQEKD